MRPATKQGLGMARLLCATAMLAAALGAVPVQAQTAPYERAFPQSKATIEKALKAIQGNLAGRLPTLDGFAKPGELSLDHYQRGYYQSAVEVISTRSGGSIVRVASKVTAWYADPAGARSGYQLLTSNGRLEADLLDQLSDEVAKITPETGVRTAASAPAATPIPAPAVVPPHPPVTATASIPTPAATSKNVAEAKKTAEPAIPAASPSVPRTFPTSPGTSIPPPPSSAPTPEQLHVEKEDSALQAEASSLEEVLKNMAHPRNLVAVKKSGTPVVATPSLTAKPQFLASGHDEFELLDFNADWVHVRISGLSRGWIWRNSVEMPDGIADTDVPTAATQAPAADLFHVIREEAAPFPGDWGPLRGKTVKIISVQKIDETSKDAGPKERLEYAKFLLEKTYKELPKNDPQLQGVVVIFDSADGGMIAATATTLQQWIAGTLSDAALWHNCFFDPPETFDSATASGSK
jgi:hypothetical protein